MPRLFYKVVVGSAFAVAALALIAAEALLSVWIVDNSSGVIAWAAYAGLGLVGIIAFVMLLDAAVEYVRRA